MNNNPIYLLSFVKYLTLIFLLLLPSTNIYAQDSQDHILVFSKTKGWRHASITMGVKSLMDLGSENNFLVTATEDGSFFTKNQLDKFNAVVFLNTTGDIFTSDQKLAFQNYIKSGGGFVGIHSATDTEYKWEWYGKLVGAYFNGHPEQCNAMLEIVDSEHASTSFLPKAWKRWDEWYNFKNINPNIKVLITIDEDTYEGGTNGKNHPMAWCHEFDGGRSFYTALGHTKESWQDSLFRKHILGGLDYVMQTRTDVVDDPLNITTQEPKRNIASKQAFELYNDFPSEFISSRDLEVWLPKAYNGIDPLPVLYMFDGQNMFHGIKGWGGEYQRGWEVDETLDSLISNGKIPPVIVVGLWNGGMKRMAEYMPQKPHDLVQAAILNSQNQWEKDYEKNPPNSDAYLKYLVEEVKPFIDSNYKTKSDRDNTYVGGSSMGGIMSAYAICEYPEVFGGAACFSSHWPSLNGVFVEYVKKNLPDPATHKIYFDFGTLGLDAMYAPFQKEVDKVMVNKGYETNKNWITKKFENEDHNETFWRKRFYIPMEFLLK